MVGLNGRLKRDFSSGFERVRDSLFCGDTELLGEDGGTSTGGVIGEKGGESESEVHSVSVGLCSLRIVCLRVGIVFEFLTDCGASEGDGEGKRGA
jgi:hypothetical protein